MDKNAYLRSNNKINPIDHGTTAAATLPGGHLDLLETA